MTMKLIAVSLTLKLLLSCPPFLVCPPSLSWTARSRLLILSMRPLICPWSIPCDFLIRMQRRSHPRTATPWQVVHISLSLVAIPPFTDRRWWRFYLMSCSSHRRTGFYQTNDPSSFLFGRLSHLSCYLETPFPVLPLLYASHLWPLCLVTDNYWWVCSSQPIYPKRDQKNIIYKRRAKETPILLVTIQRFSLNRGFCNFWNSTLSHSSARKSTKQHRSATQDVSKCAEINGDSKWIIIFWHTVSGSDISDHL